ncbi:deoxyribodipyrimidine photo-lyase [Clostridiaceae bacterium HFYG-1003]|nr:deoxyribodipyrimidine photo-lyase [Clostridiaceae bacterium HFYG-1003]
MIHDTRIQPLNDQVIRSDGNYVLYWMQASQRTRWNHALEFAIREANRLGLPLVTGFGLTDAYPEANRRHYTFMEEGLLDIADALARRSIPFLIRAASPEQAAIDWSGQAALLVTDRGYQKHEVAWRETAAQSVSCAMIQVETNVVVPVETVSAKEEYAAATIRRKIERLLPEYGLSLDETALQTQALPAHLEPWRATPESIRSLFKNLRVDESVPAVSLFYSGGEREASRLLEEFIEQRLDGYAELRNDPARHQTSNLSPYLHFGQISPLEIYLALTTLHSEDKRSFLDELIVRRELSMNFVRYNPHYDTYDAIGSFARLTLDQHALDPRPVLYSLEELEQAKTHDPYWNAAQLEMTLTGKMSGYLRMYWGKKVLEWSPSPAQAYHRLVLLNNKYSLDGRDPNGYAGIAWCFGKHDRAWSERPIFGKVRYMNDKGLERKFRIGDYVRQIEAIQSRLREPDRSRP